jgi:hypothetical protein
MKRALYSLSLVFLLSCGTAPEQSHVASVHLRNGDIEGGWLTAVRTDALEMDVISGNADTTSHHSIVIPFTDVDFVRLRTDGTLSAFALGMGIGTVGFGTIGYVAGSGSNDVFFLPPMRYIAAFGGGLLGGIAGGLTGCLIQQSANDYSVNKTSDVEYLRSISLHPEMK